MSEPIKNAIRVIRPLCSPRHPLCCARREANLGSHPDEAAHGSLRNELYKSQRKVAYIGLHRCVHHCILIIWRYLEHNCIGLCFAAGLMRSMTPWHLAVLQFGVIWWHRRDLPSKGRCYILGSLCILLGEPGDGWNPACFLHVFFMLLPEIGSTMVLWYRKHTTKQQPIVIQPLWTMQLFAHFACVCIFGQD